MTALCDPKCNLLRTNAFGLMCKLGEFQHVVTTHLPDIVDVTETTFTVEKCTNVDATLPGYQPPILRDRKSSVQDSLRFQTFNMAFLGLGGSVDTNCELSSAMTSRMALLLLSLRLACWSLEPLPTADCEAS